MSTPTAETYAKSQLPPTAPAIIGRELTHADRCDQCGAAAYVRTESIYSTLQLTWCAHHYTEHEGNGHFSPETHEILDERSFLKSAVKAQATADTTNWTGKK
jgi:hypothetical protein